MRLQVRRAEIAGVEAKAQAGSKLAASWQPLCYTVVSWPSTLGMLVGFVLYGFATLQARVLPRWYGLALLASMPVSLPLEVYGTALFGMFLVVLGCVLWLRKDTTTEQSPRVR